MTNINTNLQVDKKNNPLFLKEGGTKTGAPIIFIHGLLASHVSWQKQFNDDQLKKYRLISYDLRGHGLSIKPNEAKYFNNSRVWANDLNSIITTVNLSGKKALLVGWSLGSAVISDYINVYGVDNVSAVLYLDPVLDCKDNLNQELLTQLYQQMIHDDLVVRLPAIATFVKKCFSKKETPLVDSFLVNAGMASEIMLKNFFHYSGTQQAIETMMLHHIKMYAIFGKNSELIQVQPSINYLQEIITNKQTKQIFKTVKGYQYGCVALEDTGHAVHIESPDNLSHYIREIIDLY